MKITILKYMLILCLINFLVCGCVKQTNDYFKVYRNTNDLLLYIKARVNQITGKELDEKLNNEEDFVLLDVRDLSEFLEKPILEAEHMERGTIEFTIEEEYPDKNMELVLFCNNGDVSLLAVDALMSIGYKNIKHLKDGLIGWGKIKPEELEQKGVIEGAGCQ